MDRQFKSKIITASAGTGKTYRLSLEYIAIVLNYSKYPDFQLDSILGITFTKKATAEIRERILEHFDKLIKAKDEDLLKNLRELVPGDEAKLTDEELRILEAAKSRIVKDNRMLQIMTIDGFTNSIFRNIVRPLRSFGQSELDENVVDKRMPYLFEHLMTDEFRGKVDIILTSKINRSLDSYKKLFEFLIDKRWMYYVITERLQREEAESVDEQSFIEVITEFFEALEEQRLKNKKDYEFSEILSSKFARLFLDVPQSKDEAIKEVEKLLQSPYPAKRLYKVLLGGNLYDGRKYQKNEKLQSFGSKMQKALGTKLYYELLLPEQEQILEVWGLVLKEYEKLVYRYKDMSYSDITWFTFETLFGMAPPRFDFSDYSAANEFYQFLSHRTRFMLIDEFQDTSILQFYILKPIMEEICAGQGSKDYGGVVVVGDEKQSIFGWRDGERQLLLKLRQSIGSLRDADEVELTDSYRSSHLVMEFINEVFGHKGLHRKLAEIKLNWGYPEVKSAKGQMKGEVVVKHLSTKNLSEEDGLQSAFDYLIKEMVRRYKPQDPKESVAIICRTNKQLQKLQLLMEGQGDTVVYQPAENILQHNLVGAIHNWLKFVAYGDWIDCLKFLRSDFLLLKSDALKAIIDSISAYEKEYENSGVKPARSPLPEEFDYLLKLAEKQRSESPYKVIYEILGLMKKVKGERDQKNLQHFLSLAKNWETSEAKRGQRLSDFLDYLNENLKNENFSQVEVQGEGGIQLLTIHKAKGLQFDRVFVYYDLSYSSKSDKQFSAIEFKDDTYEYIKDYVLTYHHKDLLPNSPVKPLYQAELDKGILEELNSLYVAFTRAKSHLYILFSYGANKSFDDYYQGRAKKEDEEKKLNLPLYIAKACRDYFYEKKQIYDGDPYRITSEEPELKDDDKKKKDEDEEKKKESVIITELPAPKPFELSFEEVKKVQGVDKVNHRTVYFEQRNALYGDVAHYYLRYIKKGGEREHQEAFRQTIAKYGDFIKIDKLRDFLAALKEEIEGEELAELIFDPAYDKVYNEFPIGDKRIDRLMVDTKGKKAFLIDYKTGKVNEPEQLHIYKKMLKELPAFAGYTYGEKYQMLKLKMK